MLSPILGYDPGISPNDPTAPIRGIALVVFALCVVSVLLWAIIRSATRGHSSPAVGAADNRPGNFRVVGIDRKTKLDVVRVIEAASQANAVAKAELDGILVTAASRV